MNAPVLTDANPIRRPARMDVKRVMRQGLEDQARGDHRAAWRAARSVLDLFAMNTQALLLAGQSELMLEHYDDCVDTLTRLIRLEPRNALALNNRGVAYEAKDERSAALKDYAAAVAVEPDFLDARLNQARCLQRLGRYEEAIRAYTAIARQAPGMVNAWVGLGEAHREAGHQEESLQVLGHAVELDPQSGSAWYALGNAHLEFKQWDQAVEAYGRSSVLMPRHALTYSNCAKALRELKQFDDALLVCEAAIAIEPDCLPAWRNKSVVLLDLGRWALAIEACAELLKRNPDDANGHNNLGFALHSLRRYEAALDAFQTATRKDPQLKVAWFNEACALELLHRHEEVGPCYEQVLRLDPHYPNLIGRMGHARHYVCNWTESALLRRQIVEELKAGHASCDPFRIITFSDRAEDQRDLARRWLQTLPQHKPPIAPLAPVSRRQRIRVGYFSADFHLHATTMLMAQMLELHDKSRFEIIGFSFGERREDEMKARMRRTFDSFHDILTLSDDEAAEMAREMELDIAVDLKGYTKDGRIGLFQRRVAPIQISYLGYPGTLGAPFMDYIVADHTVIPDELRAFYDEKVIRVPGTYQANDSSRQVPAVRPSRADLGLPTDGFVFCCFNNAYKITPEVYGVWMRLLKAVPGSVLWLLTDTRTAENNLRREAAARGVDPARLIFAARMPTEQHLARQGAADLFLDTLPCNAHTTASDALRVGLPVLTCTGTSFASRVAASLLHAQGLDELITCSLQDYERMALELATEPAKMRSIRARAERAIQGGRLLDTPSLTRALEQGYERVVERALAGLAPDHIDI